MRKSGYLRFGDGPGDHSGIFADIDLRSLFGGNFHQSHRVPACRLVSTNPTVADRFNKLFDEKLTLGNVHNRMEKLRIESMNGFTVEHAKEYEKRDNIQLNAFKYADKRCRKLKMGEVRFAGDEIQKYGAIIRLCTYLIRNKCNCKVSVSVIRKVAKKAKISDPFSLSIDDAKTLRSEARSTYRRLKPNSREIRDKWMDRMTIKLGIEEGNERALYIRRQRQQEHLRDSHRKIKVARGEAFRAGTDRVTVSSPEGHTVEITEKSEMEKILMETNKE